jgi:PTS system mannose-specific IID component
MTMDGEVVMNIQEMLDQIFVGLIPLVITLLSFYLLKKKIVSINVLIFGMIILGIVLALLGIA